MTRQLTSPGVKQAHNRTLNFSKYCPNKFGKTFRLAEMYQSHGYRESEFVSGVGVSVRRDRAVDLGPADLKNGPTKNGVVSTVLSFAPLSCHLD